MSFNVQAEAYDRFMGRYSKHLTPRMADFAGVSPGQRAVDVGCGTGILTAELLERLGADAVSAVDPSEPFVAAARERYPGVDVHLTTAEGLPFDDESFDVALAQLVVHFMKDPVKGLQEMARVTRSQGVVAACVWDHGNDRSPIGHFWQAARELDPAVGDEANLAGARQGHLADLLLEAGLSQIEEAVLTVAVEHPTFGEWWDPFTTGVGPAGAYYSGLGAERQSELRELCQKMLPGAPLLITGAAWAAKGVVG